MEKRICIITGANAGIGKQAALRIGENGHHAILACRNRASGEAALNEMRSANPSFSGELRIVDLGLRASIAQFVEGFNAAYDRLDVLIHNAAVFNVTQKSRAETSEGIETVWATNHLGPVLMTALLRERLERSGDARVITISSKGLLAKPFLKVDLNDVEFKSKRFNVVNAYYQSKLAQMMFTLWAAACLKDARIAVNCIRVPAVKIDLARHPDLSPFMRWVYCIKAKSALEPSEMAKAYTNLAFSEEFSGVSGKYFDEKCREVGTGKYCADRRNIDAVTALTEQYVPEIRGLSRGGTS